MHEILAKIARLAFSKGAAFCYAVTVGVSGQLAYNYLQPRDPAPKTVAVAVPVAIPRATVRRRGLSRRFPSSAARTRAVAGEPRRRAGSHREAGAGPVPRDRADPAGTPVIVAAEPGGAARSPR